MRRISKTLFVLAISYVALSAHSTVLHAEDSTLEIKTGTQGRTSARNEGLPQGIIDDLGNWRVWVVLVLAIGFGSLGSLAYELVEGRTSLPSPAPAEPSAPTVPPKPDGGFWPRVLLGGFAAVAVLYPLKPEELIGLIGLSLIAGSMGTALFKTLQERVKELAKTARLASALAANELVLRDIHRLAQEGTASAKASGPETLQISPAKSEGGGVVTLSIIASLAEAGLRSSQGALMATTESSPAN